MSIRGLSEFLIFGGRAGEVSWFIGNVYFINVCCVVLFPYAVPTFCNLLLVFAFNIILKSLIKTGLLLLKIIR